MKDSDIDGGIWIQKAQTYYTVYVLLWHIDYAWIKFK